MNYKSNNYWALILGGSSGFGLAAAKKLATMGINIIAVHRDRKGAMTQINEEFKKISDLGVDLLSINTNALTSEGRKAVLEQMTEKLKDGPGRVRLVMHSIALGNLKLIAPLRKDGRREKLRAALAQELGVSAEQVGAAADNLFESGYPELSGLVDEPDFDDELLMEEEDMAQTIYAMGTSLLSWVQDIFNAGLFASDARILAMTSEGNAVAMRAYGAVSAAKTALEAVSRSIALEFAPYGIRSNVIQAGVTDTPALRLIPGNDQIKASALQRNPFARLTLPEDVGDVVGLMASDESAWINGEIIRVDGGEHIAG